MMIFWKPVLEKVLSFSEASMMSMDDLLEANAALEIKAEQEKSKTST